jgi:hypothetical protein
MAGVTAPGCPSYLVRINSLLDQATLGLEAAVSTNLM